MDVARMCQNMFLKADDGATAVEYALIICFIAVLIAVGVGVLGPTTKAPLERVAEALKLDAGGGTAAAAAAAGPSVPAAAAAAAGGPAAAAAAKGDAPGKGGPAARPTPAGGSPPGVPAAPASPAAKGRGG